jgi:hypothetical protein
MRALGVGLALLAVTAQARPTSYALVIGNNAPPISDAEALPTLRFADDDAARWFKFFERLTAGTYVLTVLDADSQRRHPDVAARAQPPGMAELKAAVKEIARQVQADIERGDAPTVYFTFSGHGVRSPDGTYFLALSDGKLTREQLFDEVLAKLEPAYVHLFIDACHAEGLVGERGTREVDVPKVAVAPADAELAFQLRLPAKFPRVGAITAVTVDQQAHEWSRIEAGVFTYELLSALSGAADVNNDGLLEYSEVQAFIASANRDLADPRATPKVMSAAPRINVHAPVLALSSLKNTGFVSGLFPLGHFHVELENGQRLLDAHLAPDQRATLAIPEGKAFLIASGKEAELQIRASQTIRAETLNLEAPRAGARGSLEAALSRALFQSSFGATYYRGYTDSLDLVPVVFSAPPQVERQLEPQVEPEVAPTPFNRRRVLAPVMLGVSATVLAAALFSTALAATSWSEYEQTTLQRPAFEARQRATVFTTAAAITGASALALAAVGWWLWPARSKPVALSVHFGSGEAALALSGNW